jgi:hypothetical protein
MQTPLLPVKQSFFSLLRNNCLLARFKTVPWSIGFALGMVAWMAPHPEWHGDLAMYRATENLHYLYWARWILAPLRVMPEMAAYILLSLICLALLYGSLRIYGGVHWVIFTSFALGWDLFYGQVDGLVVGGLALAYWALEHNRPYWMGIGFVLASIKPHLSLPLMIAFWIWSPNKLKPMLIPALISGLSFLRWGFWVPAWVNTYLHDQDLTLLSRNISWWQIAGVWGFLVWLPVIFARLPRPRKVIAVAAATAFCMPYFPLPSSVIFLVMPIPIWAYVVAQLPLLGGIVGYWIYDWMKILPTTLVVWALWPAILPVYRSVKSEITNPKKELN